MSFLPSDLSSFVWGALAGGVAAFATGLLKKAGERTFTAVENKLNPKPPEPVQVDGRFVPKRYSPPDCAWVNELKLYDYEHKGYTYYPHAKADARCFRITSDGRNSLKEFLLVQPNAKRTPDA
jgi:hypothetical protein